jgi:hypothetical protein
MQMTITSTELLKGGRVPTLQEGQRGHHQRDEGHVCASLVGKPGPALQTVDAYVDNDANATADMDDNPLDETELLMRPPSQLQKRSPVQTL